MLLLCAPLLAGPVLVCAQSATSFDELAQRAAAARDAGNAGAAIDLYQQAVEQKADWQEGWFYLGVLNYGANQYASATVAFNRFLELKPRTAPVQALRGLCEFETAAYDGALSDLEQAVSHGAADDPHNEQIIRYHFAQLLTRAGRFEDAMGQYQFFAKHHIDDPDLQVGLGLAGARMALLTSEAPATDRPMLEAVGRAGYTFLSGDTEAARPQFAALFQRYPAQSDLYLFYATLLFRDGSSFAITELRNELTATPDNGYLRAVLAFTLTIAGRYQEARPEAEQAIAKKPDLEMAQIALGRSLVETRNAPSDDTRADEVLHAVLTEDPNNLEAHMALAALYSRTGRRDDEYHERMECLRLEN